MNTGDDGSQLRQSKHPAFATCVTPHVFILEQALCDALAAIGSRTDQLGITTRIFYAFKACPLLPVASVLLDAGIDGFEVHSAWEVEKLRHVAPNATFVWNGPGRKSHISSLTSVVPILNAIEDIQDPELANALETGRYGIRIAIESIESSFHRESKKVFGFLPREIDEFIEHCVKHRFSPPHVLHLHGYCETYSDSRFAILAEIITEIVKKLPRSPFAIDIGGGFTEPTGNDSNFCSSLYNWEDLLRSLSVQELWLEPGRALVRNAAVAIATVTSRRQFPDYQLLTLDLGTNFLVPIPGAAFSVEPLSNHPGRDTRPISTYLCDETCSPQSLFTTTSLLPKLEVGDRLCFGGVGAYTFSFAEPLFHSPLPATSLIRVTGEEEPIWDQSFLDDLSGALCSGAPLTRSK